MKKEREEQHIVNNDDGYYEDLIPKLYKPANKQLKAGEVILQELPFETEIVPAPGDEDIPEVTPEATPDPSKERGEEEEKGNETALYKLKKWLLDLISAEES